MKKYLLNKSNIPKDKFILENKSTDTITNIKNFKKILQKYNYSSLSIISSEWHLPRVKFICQIFLQKKITFVPSLEKVHPKRIEGEKQYLAYLKKIY